MFFEPSKKTHYHFPSVNSITKCDVGYPFYFPEIEKREEYTNQIADAVSTAHDEKEYYNESKF